MSVQTAFAEKLSCAQNGNDGFLAFLGDDDQFDLALLNVEHLIRDIALRENALTGPKFQIYLARSDAVEEPLRIERFLGGFSQFVFPEIVTPGCSGVSAG